MRRGWSKHLLLLTQTQGRRHRESPASQAAARGRRHPPQPQVHATTDRPVQPLGVARTCKSTPLHDPPKTKSLKTSLLPTSTPPQLRPTPPPPKQQQQQPRQVGPPDAPRGRTPRRCRTAAAPPPGASSSSAEWKSQGSHHGARARSNRPEDEGIGFRRGRKRKPNLEELGGSVGGLAGGDLEEGGDQGLLLRGRRGIAGHGGVVASTGFFPPCSCGLLVSRVRWVGGVGWGGVGSKQMGRKRAG